MPPFPPGIAFSDSVIEEGRRGIGYDVIYTSCILYSNTHKGYNLTLLTLEERDETMRRIKKVSQITTLYIGYKLRYQDSASTKCNAVK